MHLKTLALPFVFISLSACQLISPIFVEYNGVRRDVAQWINQQTFLSMQQKRSLAQLSKAQQKLVHIDRISSDSKLSIAKENSIAMHCAQLHLKPTQIEALQSQIFANPTERNRILERYDQEFPKLRLDPNLIQCE